MAALLAGLLLVGGSTAAQTSAATCTPTILESPRAGAEEVQAKALNDNGDVVGFADGHAILWPGGKAAGSVDLGLLPGYVSAEAYGVNNSRVVFGVLYDKKERAFPFRWQNGQMTVLKDHQGRLRQVQIPNRNAINESGQIAGTLLIGHNLRAVRWAPDGKATLLPKLKRHFWTLAWSINQQGIVSGWSRRKPSDDGENNAVIWTETGQVVRLKAPRGRRDGAAEATNSAGLTVGYTGNLGTDKDLEHDQAAIWSNRNAKPTLIGRKRKLSYAELVDVNDAGQAAGMVGRFTKTLAFTNAKPAIWKPGLQSLQTIPFPAASAAANKVVVAELNDINAAGSIVGNVFGLTGKSFNKLRRIDPVLWTCAFGP